MSEIIKHYTEKKELYCPNCHSKLGQTAIKSETTSDKSARPVMPSREMSQVRSSETSGGPRAVMSPSTRKVIKIPLMQEFLPEQNKIESAEPTEILKKEVNKKLLKESKKKSKKKKKK